MFRIFANRRRERVWVILKARNPELTREEFNDAYEYATNLLKYW